MSFSKFQLSFVSPPAQPPPVEQEPEILILKFLK